MEKEMCVLPVRCEQCSSVFDLWYDLQAQEQIRKSFSGQAVASVSGRFGRRLLEQQSLCWECRKDNLSGKVRDEVELAELDLTLEFE